MYVITRVNTFLKGCRDDSYRNVGAVCRQRHGYICHETIRCSIKQRQRIIASNNNPIIKDVGRGYACYYCWMNGPLLYVHGNQQTQVIMCIYYCVYN